NAGLDQVMQAIKTLIRAIYFRLLAVFRAFFACGNRRSVLFFSCGQGMFPTKKPVFAVFS
ncbi:hypothetical protein, partial [Acetobacter sp. UBA5411]|uniref:hypothetical protein n=1 Tax=Acetobacter sp. UBA5411 TaxID=1945905 RepID=UPI0025BA75F5